MKKEVLKLRGHHLGCVMSAFRGKTDHPTVPKAIEWLKKNPEGLVEIIIGPDDICLPCPHWDGNTCTRGFEELNKRKDRKFIEQLKVKEGEKLPGRKVFKLLIERTDLDFFKRVCPNCSPEKCAKAASGNVPF